MQRVRIDNSSYITEAAYDSIAEVLEVHFTDGVTLWYFGVPAKVAAALFDPPSGTPGEYFHAHIRGVYEFARF